MQKQKPTTKNTFDRTECLACGKRPMVVDEKNKAKASCPTCDAKWNFDLIRCPNCDIPFCLKGNIYRCVKCQLTPMKEKDVRDYVKAHYKQQGYGDPIWESPPNGPGADIIFHQEAMRCAIVIEAKGENLDTINGLADVQKALGQIIEHIDNPQGTSAEFLAPLAQANTTFIYAIAVPQTPYYLKWCGERVSQSVRKILNLHWLFVERHGQVNVIGPLSNLSNF